MKILFFEPYAINTPHFETTLELAENHIYSGDMVKFVRCNASLASCDVNLHHDLTKCLACMSKRNSGLRMLRTAPDLLTIVDLSLPDRRKIKKLKTRFSDIYDLKSYKIDGFDIGYGVASSLISANRDPEPDMKRYQQEILRLLKSAYAVYLTALKHIKNEKPDLVYAYNGRYAPLRAVLRAAQASGVDCYLHEVGGELNRYVLVKNSLLHEVETIQKAIREHWVKVGRYLGMKQATEFYQLRRRGIIKTWHSFTDRQEPGRLPADWDIRKINLIIFTSSEDEFAAIGDSWKNPLYTSQLEGIKKMISSLEPYKNDIHFYIRLHPNLKNVSRKQVVPVLELSNDFVTVISPEDTVNTYDLMLEGHKIISFGSTIGIEAAYWGKISILVGMCWYRGFGSTYEPLTHEELIGMLLNNELLPLSKIGALMYGAYLGTFGIRFKHFKKESIFEGKFKGVKVEPSYIIKRLNLFLNSSLIKGFKNVVGNLHAKLLY